jgi:hypothetical protein
MGPEVDADLDCDLQPALGRGALLLVGEIGVLTGSLSMTMSISSVPKALPASRARLS